MRHTFTAPAAPARSSAKAIPVGPPNADGTPAKKKRRGRDKLSKGLRHFSTRVCKKVEEKQKTSFNEVADEIVHDFVKSQESGGKPHNEKNIRRRVYDALNVLMAMGVITKKRKAIVWKGLPSNAQHDMELLKVPEFLSPPDPQDKFIFACFSRSHLIYKYTASSQRCGERRQGEEAAPTRTNGTSRGLPRLVRKEQECRPYQDGIANRGSIYISKYRCEDKNKPRNQ